MKNWEKTFNLFWNAPFQVPREHPGYIQEVAGKLGLKIKIWEFLAGAQGERERTREEHMVRTEPWHAGI